MKKCRHKRTILMSAFRVEFTADQEPYESGKIERAEVEEITMNVDIHYCPKCKVVTGFDVDGIC